MAHETVALLQEDEKFSLPALAGISPYFSIPRLDDKPQDPIVQSIHSHTQSGIPYLKHHASVLSSPPTQFHIADLSPGPVAHAPNSGVSSLWNELSLLPTQATDLSVSWDARSNDRNPPFLTEQPAAVSSFLQSRAQPSTHPETTKATQLSECDPFSSLRLVVLGTSSPLYVWDVRSQSFVQKDSSERYAPDLLVQAKPNSLSRSNLQRFLDLGTLVRRLEILIQDLRRRQGRIDPVVHAFAHGLSSVLTFIRNRLSRGPLFNTTGSSNFHCLATVWLYYAELEQLVTSLASMCHRSIDTAPDKFSEIPTSPVDLLCLVYETFEMHVELHSPRDIIAIVAYILTVTSKPYIGSLCKLLAYGEGRWLRTAKHQKTQSLDLTMQFEGDAPDMTFLDEDGGIDADGPFPKFIPSDLASIISVAHRSLKLLEAAQPDHPIHSTGSSHKDISWLWTESSINTAWSERDLALESQIPETLQVDPPPGNYDPELQDFRIFDLEPGTFPSQDRDHQVILDELMNKFPKILPNIAPSPSLLCQIMFTPLHTHAASLSRALLAVFLDRSSFLCIDSHLELLRSHMLLTSHSFKSRLTAALFSDAEDRVDQSAQTYNLLRYRSRGTTLPEQPPKGRWPVGLAPLLVTRDSWPPGGSELSFILRTVIVDSQQTMSSNAENATSSLDGSQRVVAEAEFRLGFAIRELSGRGRERWLDPLSIEALDFLYLDYKVPHPLDALVPTSVLSKYQRIFALLLRLTRVECAIRAVFRLTRSTAYPLFPTLASSQKLLLHFRFVAHSFLTTLSTYIYDTAIGGNFDAFLARIAACRENPDAPSGFTDAFALADCHSSVLDDILSACLLRSSQRAAGDVLRGTLEIILEFCVFVGDLKNGGMAEYRAAPVLEELYASFRKKIFILMNMIGAILEKDGKSWRPEQLHLAHPELEHRVPPGGVESLRHLSTGLNQSDWWIEVSKEPLQA